MRYTETRTRYPLEGISGTRKISLGRLAGMSKACLKEHLEFRGYAVYDETKAEMLADALADLSDEMKGTP